MGAGVGAEEGGSVAGAILGEGGAGAEAGTGGASSEAGSSISSATDGSGGVSAELELFSMGVMKSWLSAIVPRSPQPFGLTLGNPPDFDPSSVSPRSQSSSSGDCPVTRILS